MAIEVFSDVILPNCIVAAGISGKSIRQNTRSQNQGGFSTINIVWTASLRQFDIGFIPLLPRQWALIEGLFEITSGGAYGLLMTDPKDSFTSVQDGAIVYLGNGLGQLYKTYRTTGTVRTYLRKITRPAPNSTASGVINYNNGTVTVSEISRSVLSYGIGITTTIAFSNGDIPALLTVGQSVTISGATGTGATLLNGVRSVVSKSLTSFAVDVNSTGLTLSGGTVQAPSGNLSWTGNFFVPVQFATDELDWSLVRAGAADNRLVSGQSIILQEIRE